MHAKMMQMRLKETQLKTLMLFSSLQFFVYIFINKNFENYENARESNPDVPVTLNIHIKKNVCE